MRSRRYLWNGHVVYVALVHKKWFAVYDGECGDPSMIAVKDMGPSDSRALAQARLDRWAAAAGLEEWKP